MKATFLRRHVMTKTNAFHYLSIDCGVRDVIRWMGWMDKWPETDGGGKQFKTKRMFFKSVSWSKPNKNEGSKTHNGLARKKNKK